MGRTRGISLVVVVGLCGLLLGCGGSAGSAKEEESPSAAETTASATASQSAPAATTEQYASIVARADIPFRQMSAANCDWLGSGPLDWPGSITCQAGLLTTSYASRALAMSLANAQDPTGSDYIGEPPAELSSLVDETMTNSRAAGSAMAKAFHRDCADSGRGPCGLLRIEAWRSLQDLQDTLRAWGPYI